MSSQDVRSMLFVLLSSALASCGAGGSGTLNVVVEAEDTITDGIPASTAVGTTGFADGWTLRYEFFYVDVGRVAIADAQNNRVEVPTTFAGGDRVFDLRAAPTTAMFTVTDVPPRRYDRVSYRSVPVSATTTFADGIPAEHRAMMQGYSMWFRATATKGTRTIRLNWMFRDGYEYADCAAPEGTPGLGVVVTQGGTTTARLTIHGDHWYWQTLGMEGSPTRFDPIANADTTTGPYRGDGDGETTLAELDAVTLADVPPADGTFDPAGRPVTTLGDYMRATTGTLGHLDGDGVCASRPAP
jgi:hypothetical protein